MHNSIKFLHFKYSMDNYNSWYTVSAVYAWLLRTLSVMAMKDVTPYGLVDTSQHVGGTYCLNLHVKSRLNMKTCVGVMKVVHQHDGWNTGSVP
jgi:hypothetical protein